MKLAFLLVINVLLIINISAQKATIYEEKVNMKTYMFSDPDPVPNIGRIYPYFRFDGFTNSAIDKDWNMVVLENKFIKIWVCPDIGGKVWGAIEKSTGGEFLYYNNVVKFRDVAMRGPWTSGGLEFNFGDIGHIPTCATPVDYLTRENADGSVSCIVAAIDLPSQTRWNIEIKVSPGKAFFETYVSWFNNTEIPHTYYHWMNAAAKASGNLEFIYPGLYYIGHGGEMGTWPEENGRNLSWYRNNNFGPYKSYHVVNSYSNFFGGYWHDDDFGFGHLASYDNKPGKKLWIWGLSEQGMIWEDLLTDNDGQYIEFQAGKLFNQAAPSSSYTPFKHREFQAADADLMKEAWFPIKGTGGMVAASEYAVLNVEISDNKAEIILCALQEIDDYLLIESLDTVLRKRVKLSPLQIFRTEIVYRVRDELEIVLGKNLLWYSSKDESQFVRRPVEANKNFNWESAYGLYTRALELEKQRLYNEALVGYLEVIDIDPGFLPALNRLSLAHYRRMEYKKSLYFAREALSIDTYDPEANYNYGLVNVKLGNTSEALSGFSIASHSPLTKSAALLEISKIYLREKKYRMAIDYARQSTDFNRNNISAYEVMAISERLAGNSAGAEKQLDKIYILDALSDFVRFERSILGMATISEFNEGIQNEFPYESYLDLALKYRRFGDKESAIKVLNNSPENILINLWISYLDDSPDKLAEVKLNQDEFLFPHRTETAEMLEALTLLNDDWLLKYYLGLIYWNKGLLEKAREMFTLCEMEPTKYWFWLAKAELFADNKVLESFSILKAYELKPKSWRAAVARSEMYLESDNPEKAAAICKSVLADNSENPKLGLCYARALFESEKFESCLSFLEGFEILPYEGSVDGKLMYTQVCIKLAVAEIRNKNYKKAVRYAEKAKEWPVNLGVGRPYDVDERLEDYIIAYAEAESGQVPDFSQVSDFKRAASNRVGSRVFLQAIALQNEGRNDEAAELLQMEIESDPDNIYIKWAVAKFKNSNSHSEIEKEILSPDIEPGFSNTKYFDKDFNLILEVIESMNL